MARRRKYQRPTPNAPKYKGRSRQEDTVEVPRSQKSWSFHDIKSVRPLTETQREMFEAFFEGDNIVAYGTAGTGKTFIAMYLALNEVLSSESDCQEIIIVRSAVQTRDIGFMPGTLDEKMAVYESPYRDILHELVGRASTYDDMKKAGLVRFLSTSFLRGVTWNNAVVVIDEGQNLTFHEINSVMTRIGENSVVLFLGDLPQEDLSKKRNDVTGMDRLLKICAKMDNMSLIQFAREDIVRSAFVREWIIAAEDSV